MSKPGHELHLEQVIAQAVAGLAQLVAESKATRSEQLDRLMAEVQALRSDIAAQADLSRATSQILSRPSGSASTGA